MERADKPTGEDHCGKDAAVARVPCASPLLRALPVVLVAHRAPPLKISCKINRLKKNKLRNTIKG